MYKQVVINERNKKERIEHLIFIEVCLYITVET